jgi:hypothetical protein
MEIVAFNQFDERLIEYLRSTSEVLGVKPLKTSSPEMAANLNSIRDVDFKTYQ